MGGKVWTDPEDHIFWSEVAPLAPSGLRGESKADRAKSWEPFIAVMESRMRQMFPGQEPPRKYTAVALYEHYFQNFKQGKLSPNAKPHVDKYKALLKKRAENRSGNEESESRKLRVRESSQSNESEPSGPRKSTVSVPTSAISQQSATSQIPMFPDFKAVIAHMQEFPQRRQEYSRLAIHPRLDNVSYDHGGQERLGKRIRMMDNSYHDTNVSAGVVSQNQNGVLVQQNDNNIGGQISGGHTAYGGFSGQNNMGTAYPSPITGYHDAQNNAILSFDHNAAPVNYGGVAGPGLVQNNTNPFMGHDTAQTNHDTVTGHAGSQKRKRTCD